MANIYRPAESFPPVYGVGVRNRLTGQYDLLLDSQDVTVPVIFGEKRRAHATADIVEDQTGRGAVVVRLRLVPEATPAA